MEKINLNIFEYTNYRTFLASYAKKRRKQSPTWSYGLWAKKLELSGTSALTMILNGQRNASSDICEKLSRYFSFTPTEKNYFFDLVRLEKIGHDPRLKILLMEKMATIHPTGSFKVLDDKTFRLISKWYYYAIREMTDLSDFKNDPEWIVEKLRFKATPTEAKRAVDDLLKLELLKIDPNGKLKKNVADIDTSNDISSEAIKCFHEQMLDNARDGVRTIDVSERDFSGMTISIEKKDLSKAKEIIRKFQDEFSMLLAKTGSDSTYQLNVQLFPLTK